MWKYIRLYKLNVDSGREPEERKHKKTPHLDMLFFIFFEDVTNCSAVFVQTPWSHRVHPHITALKAQ